jgi:hypothetical protein
LRNSPSTVTGIGDILVALADARHVRSPMRFLENSPDIPDELIRAVSAGEVMFLCGAGVSFGAGLPTFKDLTKQVYATLGEDLRYEHAELTAFNQNEFDRALRSLEKRTNLPGMDSSVRTAVMTLLQPPSGADLSRHLFGRNDVGEEDIRVFSDWLGLILIVNQLGKADYALIPSEVRTVLRQAGHSSLSTFAHRLAIEMESAKESEKESEKLHMWTDIIEPVFKGAWPLDLELQSSKETFKLVQLLRATGDAFPQAVEVVLPFVRAEDPRAHTSIYSLSQAGPTFYALAPEKMLELLSTIVGDAPPQSIYSLRTALDKLSKADPKLIHTKRFQKLESQASPHG